mmetsp:Transcript_38898/g.111160  ORF Transcript_38898/g.111160 Transcript_38898/m.111160 type:complete len:329 (-) Transcript_38898:2639-3625(-)
MAEVKVDGRTGATFELKKVAKIPIEFESVEESKKLALADMEAQAISKGLAKIFNATLYPKRIRRLVDFLDVDVYQLPGRSGEEQWMTVEPHIEGTYVKYNNNIGWVSNEIGADLAQAFSHWTFDFTGCYLMVVDLQGVRKIYTDPQIHCKETRRFGVGNMGERGMSAFFASHECNEVCKRLGLRHPADPSLHGRISLALKSHIPAVIDVSDDLALRGRHVRDAHLEISCELCGAVFEVNGHRYLKLHKKKRDICCLDCEARPGETLDAECDRCGRTFAFAPYWYLMRGVKEPTTCRECKCRESHHPREVYQVHDVGVCDAIRLGWVLC